MQSYHPWVGRVGPKFLDHHTHDKTFESCLAHGELLPFSSCKSNDRLSVARCSISCTKVDSQRTEGLEQVKVSSNPPKKCSHTTTPDLGSSALSSMRSKQLELLGHHGELLQDQRVREMIVLQRCGRIKDRLCDIALTSAGRAA